MKTVTAATLIVDYSYCLSDSELKDLYQQAGGNVSKTAALLVKHAKFDYKVTDNEDGTYNLED